MRIGFNGRYLQKTLSGIEYYTLELIRSLSVEDRNNDYYVFLKDSEFENNTAREALEDCRVNIKYSDQNIGGRISRLKWDYYSINNDLEKENIDIFHGPSFSIPLRKKRMSIVTIHDLAFRFFPGSYTKINQYYFKILLPQVVKKADIIVTDSYSSKKDIACLLHVPKNKIRVVYPGLRDYFKVLKNAPDRTIIKNVFGIDREYILNVSGLITPRKNLSRLIESYEHLRDSGKIDHQLVIIGKPAWSYKEILTKASMSKYSEDIIFTGTVSDIDLVKLYNLADISIFPSLYEGFGFPVLEAMACGTPTIASNISSLPEIAGDACVLIDPIDGQAIEDSISTLIGDSSKKAELSKKGIHRALNFTWSNAASQMISVYKEGSEIAQKIDVPN